MVTKKLFDEYNGREVFVYTLSGGNIRAEVLDYGGILRSFSVKAQEGYKNVILGFDSVKEYIESDFYCGATIGRCANRIENGRFTLGGRVYTLDRNNGGNHHHGGYAGFSTRYYDAEICGDRLVLRLKSTDGDQGYPGELDFTAEFYIEDNALVIKYSGKSYADTLFAPTSHAYFDLSGSGDMPGTLLKINAESFLPLNGGIVPSGDILPVAGTPFDFRESKPIGKDIDADDVQLKKAGGYDHNFCISGDLSSAAATAQSPATGIRLECFSDLPGVQFYSGNVIPRIANHPRIHPRSAFCLEPQFYPNAINTAGFDKPLLKAGESKTYTIKYALDII